MLPQFSIPQEPAELYRAVMSYEGPMGTRSSVPKVWDLGQSERYRASDGIAWRNHLPKMRDVGTDQCGNRR
jgi:hypothetical protein